MKHPGLGVKAAVGQGEPGSTGPGTQVTIKFTGALLVTRGADGKSVEILMPGAEGAGVPKHHEDNTPARPHLARLATFDKNMKPIKELSLLGRHLTIEAGDGMPDLDLSGMFRLDDFAVETVLRPFDDLYYAARIVLRGGRLRARPFPDSGAWELDLRPGREAPPSIFPTAEITWDTKRESVFVNGLDQPLDLVGESDVSIMIGHMPGEPSEWFAHERHQGQHTGQSTIIVDEDFKWLYRILVPKGHEDRAQPWDGIVEHLPVPKRLSASWDGVRPSTCFGGTFKIGS